MPFMPLPIGLCIAVLSCASSTDSSDQTSALDSARARWESRNVDDYRYAFNWNCFCIVDYVRQVNITVRGGKIVDVAHADDGSVVDPERWNDYRTIDQLFDFVTDAYDRDAFSVNVKYDRSYGYPTEVYVDYQSNVADEEKGFRIENFELLP